MVKSAGTPLVMIVSNKKVHNGELKMAEAEKVSEDKPDCKAVDVDDDDVNDDDDGNDNIDDEIDDVVVSNANGKR